MMIKNSYILLLVIMLFACNNIQESNLKKNSTLNNFATLDSIEHFFDNQNYLVIHQTDSSYLYFTRVGKNNFFTHSYKILNGDSTYLSIDTIQFNGESQLQWNWQKKLLNLQDINSKRIVWQYQKDTIAFEKKSNNTIGLVSNSKEYVLTKTIPISLFLIRYNHDFLHKTHYAFDTVNYTKKR